nr:ArsB/NhaD family transporter [Salinisphaera sp. LB1]
MADRGLFARHVRCRLRTGQLWTDGLADGLRELATSNVWLIAVAAGFLLAGLSSVMNNLPTVLVVALSTQAAHAREAAHQLIDPAQK